MNFNYNIDDYKINELEDFLKLKTNKYDIKEIEIKKEIIKKKLLNDETIDKETKQKIILFLEKIKQRLTSLIIINQRSIDNRIINQDNRIINQDENMIDLRLKPTEIIEAGNTYIIKNKAENYTYSRPSEYYRGTLNPIEIRTTNKNLTIDTRFRNNYYSTLSSNCLIDLPIKFVNVLSIQLASIEFPNSYFNQTITEDSNYFTIIINNISKVLTIPCGSYTQEDLLIYLNNLILSLSESFNYLVFNISTTQTGSFSGNGRMIITTNSDLTTPFNFTLDFQADRNGNQDYSTPLPLKLGWLLGFRQGIYTNNSSYISEGIVDLIGRRYAFLSIDEFCNNKSDSYYSAFNNSLLNKNILARISTNTSNIINFNYNIQDKLNTLTDNRRIYFGSIDITKLKIQLLDEYGRIINLNNMDFSFSLILQSAYNDI